MWINALLFQVGWFVCVMERGILALLATLIILLVHGFRYRHLQGEWPVIAVVTVSGLLQDIVLMQLGVLQFSSHPWPPVWLVCVWLLFATTLNHSLRWLQNRWALALVLGAITGPLSYLAGERLGAVVINHDALLLLSAAWGLCLPYLFMLNQLLREPMPSCRA